MSQNQKKILLGVTGSVAAKLTPNLVRKLQAIGEVQVVATEPSLYFWRPSEVNAQTWTDDRETPGLGYRKDQSIPHIALGDWADVLVIAPLTANTLAKMALGLADNLLTCLVRAWPTDKPLILAPAMNTRMLENQLTGTQMAAVRSAFGARFVPTQSKRLACGTTGPGAMADLDAICQAVQDALGV